MFKEKYRETEVDILNGSKIMFQKLLNFCVIQRLVLKVIVMNVLYIFQEKKFKNGGRV